VFNPEPLGKTTGDDLARPKPADDLAERESLSGPRSQPHGWVSAPIQNGCGGKAPWWALEDLNL
jgi:hypothetical protein